MLWGHREAKCRRRQTQGHLGWLLHVCPASPLQAPLQETQAPPQRAAGGDLQVAAARPEAPAPPGSHCPWAAGGCLQQTVAGDEAVVPVVAHNGHRQLLLLVRLILLVDPQRVVGTAPYVTQRY